MTPRLTTIVVSLFAALLFVAGGALLFLPEELGSVLGLGEGARLPLAVLGGALIGLGELNWMTRSTPQGGIYGRPLVMANLAHFTIGGLTLAKHGGTLPLWSVAAVYVLGALFYGVLLFVPPNAPAD